MSRVATSTRPRAVRARRRGRARCATGAAEHVCASLPGCVSIPAGGAPRTAAPASARGGSGRSFGEPVAGEPHLAERLYLSFELDAKLLLDPPAPLRHQRDHIRCRSVAVVL